MKLIITFCGHAEFSFEEKDKVNLKNKLIDEIRKNPNCKFYLGWYGNFDILCLNTHCDVA